MTVTEEANDRNRNPREHSTNSVKEVKKDGELISSSKLMGMSM